MTYEISEGGSDPGCTYGWSVPVTGLDKQAIESACMRDYRCMHGAVNDLCSLGLYNQRIASRPGSTLSTKPLQVLTSLLAGDLEHVCSRNRVRTILAFVEES